MQAKDLIVLGSSRLLGKLYCSDIDIENGSITAEKILVNIDASPNPGNLCSHNSSTGTGIVVVGNPNGRHIAIDPDEIQGKNGQTTADTLWLNYGGGVVRLSTSGTIQANNGTLTATTFSGTTGNITNITSTGTSTFGTATITNATVNSTLKANKIEAVNVDVADELRAAKYSIETVQNLGGHFLVCPTLEFPSTATNFSITVTKVSSTEITIAITDNQLVNQTFVDVTWNQYSKVKFVGTVNNIGIPTCSGYIQSFNTGSKTMTLRMTVTSDIADKFTTAFTGDSTKVENISVMMYQLCPNTSQSTTLFPIGIYLTAYGSNRYSYIDVYGGTSSTAIARMGKLDGLPNVNNVPPQGWGFYAKGNAYFDGTLVTKSGTIGGFSIGEYTLKNNTPGSDNSVFMTTNFTDTAVSIGGSSSALNNWRFGAGSKFGVTSDGTLYCSNAYITGEINADTGRIGGSSGWTIASQQIYSTGKSIGATDSMFFSTKNLGNNTSIGGRQGSDWRFTLSNTFGVTNAGNIYASNINVNSGSIASVVTIGGKNQSECTMLFKDPMFSTGVNGTTKYANSGASYVTWTRAAKSSDNPMTGTSYEMVCTNTGAASPGLGGVYWSHASRKNAVFVYRIITKIPTGHNIQFHSNATGDNPVRVWLTPQAGTGKFEEYIFKQICGSTGTFSTTGFFAIDGTAGTSSAPVTWYVAYAAVFDMTNLAETNNYITYISANDGIKVHNANDETNYLQLNSTAIKFVKSGTEKITIHSDGYVMLGNNSGTNGNLYIDSSGIQLRRGTSSYVTIANDSTNGYFVRIGMGTSGHVMIKNDGLQIWCGSSGSTLTANLGYGPGNDMGGDQTNAPFYTFGKRHSDTVGNWSVAEGYETIASRFASYAEGHYTISSGLASHAEGDTTCASGIASHSQNQGTIAQGYCQTAIGNYNIAQGDDDGRSKTDWAFIIGNGVSNSARSNALTVNWTGDVNARAFYDGTVSNNSLTLALGRYISAGLLSNAGRELVFSIPTGRVFPNGTTVYSISFDIVVRIASTDPSASSGSGAYYIVKKTSGGTDVASFHSITNSSFYDGNNTLRTLASENWTKTLQGGTNILIDLYNSTSNFFTGNATVLNRVNNMPCAVYLLNISVVLDLPTT